MSVEKAYKLEAKLAKSIQLANLNDSFYNIERLQFSRVQDAVQAVTRSSVQAYENGTRSTLQSFANIHKSASSQMQQALIGATLVQRESLQSLSKTFARISESYRIPLIQARLPMVERTLLSSSVIENLRASNERLLNSMQGILNTMQPFLNERITKMNSVSFRNLSLALESIGRAMPRDYEVKLDDNEMELHLTDDEIIELADITETITQQPVNWQQEIVDSFLKWCKKKPLIAFIIIHILFHMMIQTTSGLLTNAFTAIRSDTQIRQEPSIGASPIINITINEPVFIINQVPYWYEVEYVHEPSDKIYIGWVPKRNIKHIEGFILQDDMPEDGVADE